MNALKKRPVAILLTAVVIIAAALGGSTRSLTAERRRVETFFEVGTPAEGSVKGDRDQQMTICANLAAVAARYTDAGALRDAVAGYERGEAGAYGKARVAADELLDILMQTANITQQDAEYAISFQSQLTSYDYTIARNSYNDKARAFNALLETFPAGAVGRLAGMRPLEVYG